MQLLHLFPQGGTAVARPALQLQVEDGRVRREHLRVQQASDQAPLLPRTSYMQHNPHGADGEQAFNDHDCARVLGFSLTAVCYSIEQVVPSRLAQEIGTP